MTIGSRLKEERVRLGMSQTQLAALGGVGKMSQINYEKDVRSPNGEYFSALSNAGVDIQYVITGEQTKVDPSAYDKGQPSEAYSVESGASVPIADVPGPGLAPVNLYDVEGAAGAGRSLEQERVEGQIYFPEEQLAAMGIGPEQVAGIKVRGDSMETTLTDGDWVLVNLGDTDFRQEGVFLLMISGERRIKRVQRLAGGALYLISDNEHYQPEMIRPDQMREVQVLGRCEIRIGRVS